VWFSAPSLKTCIRKTNRAKSPSSHSWREGACAPQSIPELSEIAERCGVPDIYYFNRLFRARHGMPPGTYAREARMLGLGKR
jgi:AraC-like DNA-binding protein